MSLISRLTTRTLRSSAPSSTADPASASQPSGLSRRGALLSLAAIPAATLIAACGGEGSGAANDDPASGPEGSDAGSGLPAADDAPVTVADPWVKAAEDGMTSAFGVITNTTDTDLTLVSVTTPASEEVELHQTSSDGSGGMSMEEKEGGFPIPAGGELVLDPGGDHIMLMSLTAALQPGDEVELLLQFEEGAEQPITATVKDFAGANENYDPEEDGDDAHHDHGDEHEQHDHGDHDHGDDHEHGGHDHDEHEDDEDEGDEEEDH